MKNGDKPINPSTSIKINDTELSELLNVTKSKFEYLEKFKEEIKSKHVFVVKSAAPLHVHVCVCSVATSRFTLK